MDWKDPEDYVLIFIPMLGGWVMGRYFAQTIEQFLFGVSVGTLLFIAGKALAERLR